MRFNFLLFLFCVGVISGLRAQNKPTPADSAKYLLHEIAARLQLPPDATVQTLRKEIYKHLVTDYAHDCALVTLPEPYRSYRNQINKAIQLQRYGYGKLQTGNRASGAARLKWFFNTTATTNRGGQSACNSAVNTAMSNLNTRFGNAGFSANQFTLPATDPVLINQDWDAAATSNDAGELLYAFGDWLFENYPAGPGEQHLSIGVTHLASMNGVVGIATGGTCGQTSFNCEDDVFRGFVLLCNPSITNSNLVTHEIGHCFSLPHNNTPPVCPLGTGGNLSGYVMSASSGTPWHPTSLSDLYTATTWNNAQGNEYPLFNFTPLPLELIRFEAYADGSQNHLSWELAQVSNTPGTVYIQRSKDGLHYESIATEYLQENQFIYTFSDKLPLSGYNWYRLCMYTAQADNCSFSPARLVDRKDGSGKLSISPNPANSSTTLHLPEGLYDGDIKITITNTSGRVMATQRCAPDKNILLETAQLPAGAYRIDVTQEGRSWQCMLLKN